MFYFEQLYSKYLRTIPISKIKKKVFFFELDQVDSKIFFQEGHAYEYVSFLDKFNKYLETYFSFLEFIVVPLFPFSSKKYVDALKTVPATSYSLNKLYLEDANIIFLDIFNKISLGQKFFCQVCKRYSFFRNFNFADIGVSLILKCFSCGSSDVKESFSIQVSIQKAKIQFNNRHFDELDAYFFKKDFIKINENQKLSLLFTFYFDPSFENTSLNTLKLICWNLDEQKKKKAHLNVFSFEDAASFLSERMCCSILQSKFMLLSLSPIFTYVSDIDLSLSPTFNCLFAGPSGSGKSYFFNWLKQYSSRCPHVYISGENSTAIGLTVTNIKLANNEYVSEPGVLLRSRDKISVIDNMDQLQASLLPLHTFMSSGNISISKSGQKKLFRSKSRLVGCILAPFESFSIQAFISKLTAPIMSRIDLIIPFGSVIPIKTLSEINSFVQTKISEKKESLLFGNFLENLFQQNVKIYFSKEILFFCKTEYYSIEKKLFFKNETRGWNSFLKLLSCFAWSTSKMNDEKIIISKEHILSFLSLFLELQNELNTCCDRSIQEKSAVGDEKEKIEPLVSNKTFFFTPEMISLLSELSKKLDDGPIPLKMIPQENMRQILDLIYFDKIKLNESEEIVSWSL